MHKKPYPPEGFKVGDWVTTPSKRWVGQVVDEATVRECRGRFGDEDAERVWGIWIEVKLWLSGGLDCDRWILMDDPPQSIRVVPFKEAGAL